MKLALSLILGLLAAASSIAAQDPADGGSISAEAMPLYREALGSYSWKITTTEPLAQAYFNQGARLMISYAGSEARRSFEEAARIDPSCAMCWWGIVWSMGRTFNSGGVVASSVPDAREAVQRARVAAVAATPVEQGLIDAMAVRHGLDRPAVELPRRL